MGWGGGGTQFPGSPLCFNPCLLHWEVKKKEGTIRRGIYITLHYKNENYLKNHHGYNDIIKLTPKAKRDVNQVRIFNFFIFSKNV